MTNDAFEKYIDQLADHFARMAQVSGFRDHAAYRLDELSKDATFIGLQSLVLSKIADSIVEMSQKEDKEPARKRLRELVRDKSGMFIKLPELVKQKLEEMKMEMLKNLAWRASFTILVCAVVVSLLALGAYLDAYFQPEVKQEKVLVCEDGKRGFYDCKTTYY